MHPVRVIYVEFTSCIHKSFLTPGFEVKDGIAVLVFTPVKVDELLISPEVHLIHVDRILEV